jgi:hypothetical protein
MKYYLNKNEQIGYRYNHEVHKEGCLWMPSPENRIYLGEFSNSYAALEYAKRYYYANSDGCCHCCPEINHG